MGQPAEDIVEKTLVKILTEEPKTETETTTVETKIEGTPETKESV